VDDYSHPGWHVRGVYVEHQGSPLLKELHIVPSIESDPPESGITARMLRDIHLEPLLEKLRDEIRAAITKNQFPQSVFGAVDQQPLQRRGGRRGKDDLFYAQLACRYADLVLTGSERPVADLATEMPYSYGFIRDSLNKARRGGFLTPARAGRAEGEATAMARALVDADQRRGRAAAGATGARAERARRSGL